MPNKFNAEPGISNIANQCFMDDGSGMVETPAYKMLPGANLGIGMKPDTPGLG